MCSPEFYQCNLKHQMKNTYKLKHSRSFLVNFTDDQINLIKHHSEGLRISVSSFIRMSCQKNTDEIESKRDEIKSKWMQPKKNDHKFNVQV